MIIRIGKHALTTILAAVIVGALLFGALAARLAMGPIPMTWAVPYIQSAMQGEGGIPAALNLSDLSLAWDPDANHIVFTAHRVTVTQQVTTLTAVDEVEMTFSALGLLRGKLQLKDLTLAAPHFQFVLGQNNSVAEPASTDSIITINKNFLHQLHSVVIQNGTIDLLHAGSDVHDIIDHVELKWKRNLLSSTGTLAANLRLANSPTVSQLNIALKEDHSSIQLSGNVKNILPADLQFILVHTVPGVLPPNLSPERWQMATSLDANVMLSPQGALQKIDGVLTADAGHILLPEFYTAPLPIQNLQIKGTYDAQHGNWQVSKLSANILDSDGEIPFTITADGNTTLHTIHADITGNDLTAAQIKRWWPNGVAPGAIAWINPNLKDGKISNLTGAVDLHATDGENYTVTRVTAGWDLQNMSTTFLPGFPAVKGINGKATMDADSIHFNIQSGHLDDITVQSGTMDITGLSANTQILKMNLSETGQLPTMLKLLDTPPYEYIKKMGLDASTAAGGVGINVKMEFPLLAALKISDIKYQAVANLSQVSLPAALMGKDISRGRGVLEIDPAHMKINGQADVAGVPMEFTWQDFAAPKDGVTREVTFSSELLDDDHARLGLPTAGKVIGSTKLTGTYETRGGQNLLHAQMDFKDAALRVDELSYQKPPGDPLSVTTDIMLGSPSTFKLNATGNNLTITGGGALDANMNPLRLDFPVMKIGGKTDAQLIFEQTGSQQHWAVNGNALDIGQFIASQSNASKQQSTPPRVIQMKVGTLYLANQTSMKNFQANMDYNGQHWDKVIVHGDLHANASFDINWDANSAAHKLQVRTPDAGAALNALDITDGMIGGDLAIDGVGDTPNTNWLAHGKVVVKNFRMRDVSLLGRLIAAVSPGELLDKLRGKDGVGFDRMETQFQYNDSTLHLQQGKMHGQSLGLTFEGDVNHAADPTTLKLNGTFVPLYMVNGALSGIPIIGDIINGKDGGGLLGFSYSATGPAANPSVSVNPLSAFAPGFLRDLFF